MVKKRKELQTLHGQMMTKEIEVNRIRRVYGIVHLSQFVTFINRRYKQVWA
jgi:hypothetical protein